MTATTHPHAYHAIRAAKSVGNWGELATIQYCFNKKVPLRLYSLALRLEADKVITNGVKS